MKKGTANPTQSGRRPRVGSLESGLEDIDEVRPLPNIFT